MFLPWTGTIDDLLAEPPVESILKPAVHPDHLAVLLADLRRLEREVDAVTGDVEIEHVLVAWLTDDANWREWTVLGQRDGRRRPLAWKTWAITLPRNTADGAVGLFGELRVVRGASDALDRFYQQSVRASRLIDAALASAHELDPEQQFVRWVMGLYRSAEARLGAIRAPRRVRVGELEIEYQHLLHAAAHIPEARSGNVFEEAMRLAGGKIPCWYSQLEPDCISATATKLGALNSRLEQFAASHGGGHRQPSAGPVDSEVLGGELGESEQGASDTASQKDPPLDRKAILVLKALYDASHLMELADLAERVIVERRVPGERDPRRDRLSVRTVGKRVQELIRRGLATRPKGRNGGIVITNEGRRFIESLRDKAD